jgi:nucleotide-binding universal stress UspA family protein
MNETILVALDFGEASGKALDLARVLAAKLGSKLLLLHVFHQPPAAYAALDPSMFQGLPSGFVEAVKQGLVNIAGAGEGVETMLRDGEPAQEILDVVRERRPALVIMGTHGRRGVERFLLGSVAERVIRESPAPVVTVRA